MREKRRQGRRQSTEAKEESVCGKENAKVKARRRRTHRSEVRGRRRKKREYSQRKRI